MDFDDILFNLLKLTGKQVEYEKRQKEILAEKKTGKPKGAQKKKKTKKNKTKRVTKKEDL